MILDTRNRLTRQDRTSANHSRYFNPLGWNASTNALALTNAPKGSVSTGRTVKGRDVAESANRLRSFRFNASVEEQKVAQPAALLGLTVRTLRAMARDKGLTGYSKARKADLVAMLS